MSYGVYRRPFLVRRRLHAVATFTVAAAAATTSLPLARRRVPDSVYRRPPVTIIRRRGIAGLPNANPVVSLPMVRRRPPYSVYLQPPPPIVRLRRMVIGLPNADAPPPPAPAAPTTKGRRPIQLEIAASSIDLLKLSPPPVKLPPSIVVPPIAEMHFEAVTPLVVAGPVELILKITSINIILARPVVEPGSVELMLPVVPLTRPISRLLDTWSRMDRAEIIAIVQETMEDVVLLGFTDKEP